MKCYQEDRFSLQGVPAYLLDFFKYYLDEVKFKSFPAMVWPGFEDFNGLEAVYFTAKTPDYCGALFETLTICSNGNVVPCCYDIKGEIIFGNVFETNVFHIWNCEKFNDFRANFKGHKYHSLCNKCNVVSPRYLCK